MKNLFLSLSTVIAFLLMSCSNESIVTKQTDATSLKCHEELKRLESFNDSILIIKPQSRGVLTVMAVVAADVLAAQRGFKASVGIAAFITAMSGGTASPITGVAVLGATGIISAGASYGAYKGCTMIKPYMSSIKSKPIVNIAQSTCLKVRDTTTFNINTLSTTDQLCYDLIANLHDSIVNAVLCSRASISRNSTSSPIIDDIKDECTGGISYTFHFNNFGIPLFSDQNVMDMNSEVDDILADYYSDHDYEKALNLFVKNNQISKDSGYIMKLFLDVLSKYVVNEEDLEPILNKYKNIVFNSENIAPEDKHSLLIAFTIARNSFRFWKNNSCSI